MWNIYPPITYLWTVPLILDHSYLVGQLTSSKIADTKVCQQDFRGFRAFVSAIFEFVKFTTIHRHYAYGILGKAAWKIKIPCCVKPPHRKHLVIWGRASRRQNLRCQTQRQNIPLPLLKIILLNKNCFISVLMVLFQTLRLWRSFSPLSEVLLQITRPETSLSEADLVAKSARYLKRDLVIAQIRGLVMWSTRSPGTSLSGVWLY